MTSVFEHPILGALFDDGEARSIWSGERQIKHMLAFEAALSLALGETGIADKTMADKAVKLIGGFEPDMAALRAGAGRDGVAVPDLVRQLRANAPEFADAIHTGATSQDVVDTALCLSIRDMNDLLARRLSILSSTISQLDEKYGANKLMGRTRMQAALTTKVRTRVTNWRISVDENIDRLDQIRARVERVQLGGAVGDNQKLEDKSSLVTEIIAKKIGLNAPAHNWHTTRGHLAEYAGLLSLITSATGKIGQDVCLMAQQGAHEIGLSVGGGSSAMPHKQNPVLAELLVTLARFNATQLTGMHHALVHEQERSGSAWALEWMILPQMCIAAARALAACTELCGQITKLGTE